MYVIGLVDVADSHGRYAGFVADLVGEGGLEHAAVNGLALGPGLAGGDVYEVGAFLPEGSGDLHRLVGGDAEVRSEEHTSELQSLMRNSYAAFCLKKKKNTN